MVNTTDNTSVFNASAALCDDWNPAIGCTMTRRDVVRGLAAGLGLLAGGVFAANSAGKAWAAGTAEESGDGKTSGASDTTAGGTSSGEASKADAAVEVQPFVEFVDSAKLDLPDVEVRDALAEYTWEELAQIADAIARTATFEEAMSIARVFHLTDENGYLTACGSKPVELADGRQTSVRIVAFNHESLADDKGEQAGWAGITFTFCDILESRQMDASNVNTGGWEGCDLRAYLNGAFLDQLPEDLRSVIRPTLKWTNNTGVSETVDCVTTTSDLLWLFSAVELASTQNWSTNGERPAYCNTIWNSEGWQYQLFWEGGAFNRNPSEVLKRNRNGSPSWWRTRSADPSFANAYLCVSEKGAVTGYTYAADSYGMVPGFCL